MLRQPDCIEALAVLYKDHVPTPYRAGIDGHDEYEGLAAQYD